MHDDALVVAVLDTSRRITDPEIARLCRNLTLSWSRRDYSGPLLEGTDPDVLLRRALEAGHRYVFLQSYGHVIARSPGPKGSAAPPLLQRVVEQAREHEGTGVLALGRPAEQGGALTDASILVDLHTYARCGRPRVLWDVTARTLRFQVEQDAAAAAIVPFNEAVSTCAVYLDPEDAAHRAALHGLRERGLDHAEEVLAGEAIHPLARAFLTRLGTLVTRSPEGVFPWNFEGYDDLVARPAEFRGPVRSLYCVAAGFKPNAILHSHGFDARSRVVLVDYSRNALDIRRWLIDVWDGRDYVKILSAMLERFPPETTYYHLPGVASGGGPDWGRIADLWQQELADWGGADGFARHWQAYRELEHVYVHANLLVEQGKVLEHLRDEPSAVMWWSNVFYSAYALWHFDVEQRRQIYQSWVGALARMAPQLLLYGCDDINQAIAGETAEQHARRALASP